MVVEVESQAEHGLAIPKNRIGTIMKVVRLIQDPPTKPKQQARFRFEKPYPDDMWQMDYSELAGKEQLLVIIDEASRLIPGLATARSATPQLAWETFREAGGT